MTFTSPEPPWPQVHGVVVQGHQVASGQAANSPYPQGSIAMQMPIFQTLGLDLSACFAATLNVSIDPQRFRLGLPPITFPLVAWTDLHPPETFSFIPCQVQFEAETYGGWVYYPHPDTKQRHFQNDAVLEILVPPISGLGYGSPVMVSYESPGFDCRTGLSRKGASGKRPQQLPWQSGLLLYKPISQYRPTRDANPAIAIAIGIIPGGNALTTLAPGCRSSGWRW